jgi:GTP-binding protein
MSMLIKQAEFITSSADAADCPPPDRAEYAFIGRSNVGKSSLINKLVNHDGLAKTSARPGKTQLINHFLVNRAWYLVDLPGYGYARVGKDEREKFAKLINDYLTTRPSLVCTFVLIDGKIPPQKLDLDFMQNLGERGFPFVMVFTKTEKLSQAALTRMLDTYRATMLDTWAEMPEFFVTSSVSGRGREEILDYIDAQNSVYTSR